MLEAKDAFDRTLRVGDEVTVCRVRGSGRRAYQALYRVWNITFDGEGRQPLVTCAAPGRRKYSTRDRTKLVRLGR